jgi:hypothetical protein
MVHIFFQRLSHGTFLGLVPAQLYRFLDQLVIDL